MAATLVVLFYLRLSDSIISRCTSLTNTHCQTGKLIDSSAIRKIATLMTGMALPIFETVIYYSYIYRLKAKAITVAAEQI